MNIKVALKRLGYPEKWIEYGIISEDYLLSQYEEMVNSADKNAEHYRAKGFKDYLNSRASLTDQEIQQIFLLTDNGPDKCDLHAHRIIELIRSALLTPEQLEKLSNYPEVLEQPIQKVYLRIKLIQKLKYQGIDECFAEIAKTVDSAIHEFVLRLPDLKPIHVEWLAKFGANKRVRNIAKQLITSMYHKARRTDFL